MNKVEIKQGLIDFFKANSKNIRYTAMGLATVSLLSAFAGCNRVTDVNTSPSPSITDEIPNNDVEVNSERQITNILDKKSEIETKTGGLVRMENIESLYLIANMRDVSSQEDVDKLSTGKQRQVHMQNTLDLASDIRTANNLNDIDGYVSLADVCADEYDYKILNHLDAMYLATSMVVKKDILADKEWMDALRKDQRIVEPVIQNAITATKDTVNLEVGAKAEIDKIIALITKLSDKDSLFVTKYTDGTLGNYIQDSIDENGVTNDLVEVIAILEELDAAIIEFDRLTDKEKDGVIRKVVYYIEEFIVSDGFLKLNDGNYSYTLASPGGRYFIESYSQMIAELANGYVNTNGHRIEDYGNLLKVISNIANVAREKGSLNVIFTYEVACAEPSPSLNNGKVKTIGVHPTTL